MSLEMVENAGTYLVRDSATGAWLGAFGSNWHRSWVYPLYAPSGRTVVREFPFDHPFHNGVFVGQNPVMQGDRTANYWAMPVPRSADDHIMTRIGRMDPCGGPTFAVTPERVTMSLQAVWRDEHGEPVLDETRTVQFWAGAGATLCQMESRKQAAYGPVTFGKTKFGSIGMRVEERLLPAAGGCVIGIADGAAARGSADEVANHLPCDAVAYEAASLPGGALGVCMAVTGNSAAASLKGPWFIRDYGMAMFNATQDADIVTPAGEAWVASLLVVAYDGPLTVDRAAEWLRSV